MDLKSQIREQSLADATLETRRWLDHEISSAKDARHRQILTCYRDHWWGEVVGDLDAVMATLAPDPVYSIYGSKVFGDLIINTTAGARLFYSSLFDAGYYPAGPLREPRCALADWGLIIEGVMTAVLPGSMFSFPDLHLDPSAPYQLSWRLVGIHPMDLGGMMQAETLYIHDPTEVTPARR